MHPLYYQEPTKVGVVQRGPNEVVEELHVEGWCLHASEQLFDQPTKQYCSKGRDAQANTFLDDTV